MKRIELQNTTKYALIDDGDFELVSQYNWRLKSEREPYVRRVQRSNGRPRGYSKEYWAVMQRAG